ncbi:YegJ family protein [Taklimakanibacter lacteus]|uniref:YegJ family protein n=1 Tax=Taklimakanibacter lacteus TaxID=2268456 RepID=UPI000E66C5CB
MDGIFRRYIYLLIVAITLGCGLQGVAALAEDAVINVPNEDEAMNAAIAKARAGLPAFWAALADPPAETEGYALKVAITDGDNVEHFWTADVRRDGEHITAVIANEPQTVSTVTQGQRVDVPDADISDWMYLRKGKIVGNETLRVLLGYMPEEEAAQWKAMLEEP